MDFAKCPVERKLPWFRQDKGSHSALSTSRRREIRKALAPVGYGRGAYIRSSAISKTSIFVIAVITDSILRMACG
jgi:hypothetical protein